MEVLPLASTSCGLPSTSSSPSSSFSSSSSLPSSLKKRCHHRTLSHHPRPRINVSIANNSLWVRFSSSVSHQGSRSLVSHHGLRKSDALGGKHLSMSERFDASGSRRVSCRSVPKSRGTIVAVFERFTERAIKSVMLAQKEAKLFDKQEVGTEQLLLGLIAEDRASEGFLRSGVTIERAREAARSLLTQNAIPDNKIPSQVPFSSSTKRVFEAALQSSKTMGHNYIAPEHITIAILAVDVDGPASKLLEYMGLNRDKLRMEAISRLQGELANEGRTQLPPSAVAEKASAGAGTVSKRSGSKKQKGALEDFCVDLTARAREGKIDPVIGRDNEVQRVVQILGRRTKNNPMLLGEPGVGKTAIAEGLALRIVKANVPEFLNEKRVMSLDMGLLLAGAKERGELESRVTTLIDEIKQSGDIILLIDEVHTLVGSGSAGRGGAGAGLDIANLLKPPLARGELQCIGATTIVEHRKHIEKDKALARRFQPVMVDEPSQEDALKILMGLREKYEEHHKCRITVEALEAAVYLSSRYIPDRFLPDKAIDLLDEAGSRARINAYKARKERQVAILSSSPSEYWKEIRMAQAFHELAFTPQTRDIPEKSKEEDTSTLSEVLNTGSELQDNLSPGGVGFLDTDDFDEGLVVVGPEDIALIASMWSGIPLEQLTVDEQNKLIHLEETLQTRVVGQHDAVSAISRAIRRARVGLRDPNRPIATMLFCGPTGVGKTELTKALSEHYFGSESAMVRLDMSEYMERHTVSKLIGSPPGYVGYGDGGTLTEAVRRRPFTVILLDEIEKAHPDVFNLLLQIFEDGHLTDSQGRKVSFKNTLLVMTSNIGSMAIAKGGSNRIGFTFTDNSEDGKYAVLRSLVMEELKSYFRPELLNRLDEVVIFRSLEKSDVREIVEMMLKETKSRLSAKGIGLEISEAMVQLICDQGYDRTYGARPLRRAIVQLVEDNISEALLQEGEMYKGGDAVLVDVDETGNPVVKHRQQHDQSIEGVHVSVSTSSI